MKRRAERSTKGLVQPVILVILDGCGLGKPGRYNAISRAETPTLDRFFKDGFLPLDPTGRAVGLPPHQMSTSELAHLHLGAGRVVDQDFVRIQKAIQNGSFFQNSALQAAMEEAKMPGAALHLLGLCSDGGVYSHLDHLFALLEMAQKAGVEHVFIHAITDGRETPPKSAKKYLRAIQRYCAKLGVGEIASVMGRHYAMDHDNHWEREQKAYDAIVHDVGFHYETPEEAVEAAYKRGEHDASIRPSLIATRDFRTTKILHGDSVIFFNFRQDTERQCSHGFTDRHFDRLARERIRFTTLTSYDPALQVHVAFPLEEVQNSLAGWLSKFRVQQLHVAEAEKYAHVTYFFDGGREKPFRGEERVLIPSLVTTYDVQPSLSALKVEEAVLKAIRSGLYGFIVVNFANCDVVAHTGDLNATIRAVETVDSCLSALETEAHSYNYVMLVTADHGNAEEMYGRYKTRHTLNKVPFFLRDPTGRFALNKTLKEGRLGDVATTVLRIMGLPLPREMTGRFLVKML